MEQTGTDGRVAFEHPNLPSKLYASIDLHGRAVDTKTESSLATYSTLRCGARDVKTVHQGRQFILYNDLIQVK